MSEEDYKLPAEEAEEFPILGANIPPTTPRMERDEETEEDLLREQEEELQRQQAALARRMREKKIKKQQQQFMLDRICELLFDVGPYSQPGHPFTNWMNSQGINQVSTLAAPAKPRDFSVNGI